MVAEDIQKIIGELGLNYWEGKENLLIRYWTYIKRGLGVFNEFKYYIALPYATYYTIPFMKGDLWWIPLMIVTGLPVLLIIGRYDLYKIAKTTEYVNAINGSIFQFKPMEMNIEQINLLKEIRDLLKKPEELNINE